VSLRKDLVSLTVSVHNQMDPLVLVCNEAEHHRRDSMTDKVAHLMVARKQRKRGREQGTKDMIYPSKLSPK
jgi:hypothetical protein